MNNRIFKVTYWGKDRSTAVVFEPVHELPSEEYITACMVFALYDGDNVVMSKPERGWGLVGGHREDNETAEECVRREAKEEASMTLGDLHLVGRWATKKRFRSPDNEKYPDEGYQLLYVSDVKKLYKFEPQFEVSERAIIRIADIKNYHHDFDNFSEILDYIRAEILLQN